MGEDNICAAIAAGWNCEVKMFCSKCGSILIPKKENGKVVVKCRCGYEQKEANIQIREKAEKKEEIVMVDNEIETHPVVDADCPKCHNDKAYFWTRQTRASDEPETKFYKCTKCRHIWRDYS